MQAGGRKYTWERLDSGEEHGKEGNRRQSLIFARRIEKSVNWCVVRSQLFGGAGSAFVERRFPLRAFGYRTETERTFLEGSEDERGLETKFLYTIDIGRWFGEYIHELEGRG